MPFSVEQPKIDRHKLWRSAKSCKLALGFSFTQSEVKSFYMTSFRPPAAASLRGKTETHYSSEQTDCY